MGLKERTYSILLVSGAESFNAALSGLLATGIVFFDHDGGQRQRGGTQDCRA